MHGLTSTYGSFLLQNDYIYMQGINLWHPFVAIGIFAATLSASLSTMIGASRVLQAMARDDLFGFVLRPVTRGIFKGNPIVAVLISWILVQGILLIGSLNQIAQITAVLFLLSYAATNMACLALELASAPNFRPMFKYFSWHTCILGLCGTLTMMFVINAIYAACCIIACLLLIIALHFRSPVSNWGSISQALIFHQVRKYLLMLDIRKDHVKFWRPQVLLMIMNPRTCCPLIEFANDMKKSGLYVLGHVKVGANEASRNKDPLQDEYPYWLSLVDHLKVKAFVELTMAPSVREGMQHLVRISGLGAMKPNTIMLGFYDDSTPEDFFQRGKNPFNVTTSSVEMGDMPHPFTQMREDPSARSLSPQEYVGMVYDAVWLQKNVCLCRHFHNLNKAQVLQGSKGLTIDVWPVNFLLPNKHSLFDTTTLFLLQLACILHMVPGWKSRTSLRVILCVSALGNDADNQRRLLEDLLNVLRIEAAVNIVIWDHVSSMLPTSGETEKMNLNNITQQYIEGVNELIRQHSQNTAVSFVYMAAPPNDDDQQLIYLNLLNIMTANLPPTVLVHGISPVTTTTL